MDRHLQISEYEYYTVRRGEDDGGVTCMLTPFSCMRELHYVIDKVKGTITVYSQGKALYEGALDMDGIRDMLTKSRRINYLELVTMLTMIGNEPYMKSKDVDTERKPYEKIVYSLAYEPPWEIGKKLDELLKDADSEELLRRLLKILDELPWPLKDPMILNLERYLKFSRSKLDYAEDGGQKQKQKDREKARKERGKKEEKKEGKKRKESSKN